MKYTKSLFESIKESLNKKQSTDNSQFKDILKMEKGNTYVVRLIPNLEDFEKTFFHYYSHLWQSKLDQSMVSVFCPNTYQDRCPIDEYRSKVWATKDQKKIDEIKPLKRNENWMVNVFVVKDPTNPENQGQVKILRYGKQLNKIIMDAISGDDSDEFGEKIFDLSKNGCNLRIKVDENEGGYATYVSSRFQSPSELDGVEDLDEIYKSVHSFDEMFKKMTYVEIQNLLDKHWFCKETAVHNDVDDDIDDTDEETVTDDNHIDNGEKEDSDADLDELLKDL